MTRLYAEGALDGDRVEQAFQVTCDRSTMTQNDIDNGRIIASIAFSPAASIETITVLLSISAADTGMESVTSIPTVGVA
jgi:phage tail sheath protein FI